jgi:MFS family permease
VAGGLGLLAGSAFVVVERRRANPLFPPALLRHRPFVTATSIAVLAFFVLSGFLFTSSILWQEARHRSALGAGLAILPATLAIAVVSPVAGRLIPRLGGRTLLITAGAALTMATAILAATTTASSYLADAAGYLLLGIGFGLANPPITNTALNGLPDHRAGVASALATTSRQLGNVLGVAVLATIATRHPGGPTTSELRACWLIALAAGLAITALAAITPASERATGGAADLARDGRAPSGGTSRRRARRRSVSTGG